MVYRLLGYDKDNDVYILFLSDTNLKKLQHKGEELVKNIRSGSLLCSETGEPLDWVEIRDENENQVWCKA